MLFLPKGVYAHCILESGRKEVTLGRYLIEIVCRQAWIDGFRCNHSQPLKFQKTEVIAGVTHRVERCQRCGMELRKPVKKGTRSNIPEKLMYYTVGFAGLK